MLFFLNIFFGWNLCAPFARLGRRNLALLRQGVKIVDPWCCLLRMCKWHLNATQVPDNKATFFFFFSSRKAFLDITLLNWPGSDLSYLVIVGFLSRLTLIKRRLQFSSPPSNVSKYFQADKNVIQTKGLMYQVEDRGLWTFRFVWLFTLFTLIAQPSST